MTSVVPLERLTILWDQLGKNFHDELVEKKRSELATCTTAFLVKLGNLSSPANTGEGMLNCLLTHERDDFAEVSIKTQHDIKELDCLATKTFRAYSDFVKIGRQQLRL